MKIGSAGSPGWCNELNVICNSTKNWYPVLFGWYKTKTWKIWQVLIPSFLVKGKYRYDRKKTIDLQWRRSPKAYLCVEVEVRKPDANPLEAFPITSMRWISHCAPGETGEKEDRRACIQANARGRPGLFLHLSRDLKIALHALTTARQGRTMCWAHITIIVKVPARGGMRTAHLDERKKTYVETCYSLVTATYRTTHVRGIPGNITYCG